MKTFVVATNADYTVLIRAKTKESAEKKANLFYKKEYGETRDDFVAYEIVEYLDDSGPLEIRSFWSVCY